jgi:hypothetical protein
MILVMYQEYWVCLRSLVGTLCHRLFPLNQLRWVDRMVNHRLSPVYAQEIHVFFRAAAYVVVLETPLEAFGRRLGIVVDR